QVKLLNSNSCYWKQPPTLADRTLSYRNYESWLLPLATQATWPYTITNRHMTPHISWHFGIRGKPVTNHRESKRQADQNTPVWPALSFARCSRHINVSRLKSHRAPLNSCACCCFYF